VEKLSQKIDMSHNIELQAKKPVENMKIEGDASRGNLVENAEWGERFSR